MISFFTPTIKFDLQHRRTLKNWLKSVAESEGKRVGEVSVIFNSDEELLQLNREFLQHDYYTDVITFDYTTEDLIGGDIFISVDTVRANATEYKQAFDDELHRVMVHGLLHLCGYPDKTPAQQKAMRAREDLYLRKLAI